jgi:hypothetical protein
MGKYEDTIILSGRTIHTSNDKKVKEARDMPPNCGIVPFSKRPKRQLKPNCWTYIDNNGNIIQDEAEKVLRNKTNG